MLALHETFRAHGDPVECISDNGKVVATSIRDQQALTLSIEQLDAEFGFKRLHLMTYGALRDTELLCGTRETLMARGGLIGFEGVEWWQTAQHDPPWLMKKTMAPPKKDALRAN